MSAQDNLGPQFPRVESMSLEELGMMESPDESGKSVGAVASGYSNDPSTRFFKKNPEKLDEMPVVVAMTSSGDSYFEDGQHRFQAALELGRTHLPVQIQEKHEKTYAPDHAAIAKLAEYMTRRGLK